MKFFEGVRPEIFIHRAKLRRDKKTGKRLWGLTLINTLLPDQSAECFPALVNAYVYLLTAENCAAEVLLAGIVPSCTIDFFAKQDDRKPVLHLDAADLESFRLVRDGNVAELWFAFELENSGVLHSFVKEFAYTRLWAQFKPGNGELPLKEN